MRISMFHNGHQARSQQGFSLVELMVVVVIVGVLVSVAAVAMTTDPEVEDEANKIAALVNEAARQAISGGAVSPEVSQSTMIEARGRLRLVEEPAGPSLMIERLREPTLANPELGWVERKRVHLGQSVRVAGWTRAGMVDAGSVPAVVPPYGFPGLPSGPPFTECKADGTCTPMTLYLQDARRPDRKARVVVLQLNGMMTQVFSGW